MPTEKEKAGNQQMYNPSKILRDITESDKTAYMVRPEPKICAKLRPLHKSK